MTWRNIVSATLKIMHSKKKGAIPDRWTDYAAVGKRIPGTRFIAFKVPLKQSLRSHLSESEAFGPFDLLQLLENEGQELGLVIDLTFTTRYYKPQDLPDTLHYLKIFTAGHQVPSDHTILSFKKAVRKFLHENEQNDKLIGVHCTHGLNRTGYLVCRYLIDVDGFEPHQAIDLFNTCRGHAIERQNYLDDLRTGPKRSNEGMEEPDQEPLQGGVKHTQPHLPPFSVEGPHPQGPHPQGPHPQGPHPQRPHPQRPHPQRPHPYPHLAFNRGPHPEPVHCQDRFVPFHQRGVNQPVRYSPPGLLATPSLPAFSQGPRRQQGFRSGPYSAPSPYPTLMPRYTFGQPWRAPTVQEEVQEHRRKPPRGRGRTFRQKT